MAVVLVDADGKTRTVPLQPSSWSGGSSRATLTVDGETFTVFLDMIRR
jgi:hypothetical protein